MLGFWLGQKRVGRMHSHSALAVGEKEEVVGDHKPYGEVVAGVGERESGHGGPLELRP